MRTCWPAWLVTVICVTFIPTQRACGAQSAARLPQGVKPVWDVNKAYRETTPARERICINGLWRWQPVDEKTDEVPKGRWGCFQVPGPWPGITSYMQKDCQTVYSHSSSSWDYPYRVGSNSHRFEDRQAVWAMYITDNWRAFRTWGVSAFTPWSYGIFWKLRPGVEKDRETVTCHCSWSLDLPTAVNGNGTVRVATGRQRRIPLRFQVPATLEPGAYQLTMTARFSSGQTQDDSFAIHIIPKVQPPKAKAKIALFDPKGETAKLLSNMGVSSQTPLLARFSSPVKGLKGKPPEQQWLQGFYLDTPAEMDDPYRFFHW